MPRRDEPHSWIRENRRGCFIIAALLVLLVAALLYVGLSAGPENNLNAVIPTL